MKSYDQKKKISFLLILIGKIIGTSVLASQATFLMIGKRGNNMKRIFAIFILASLWINLAWASEIRLSVGDSITVNAGESVRVICEQSTNPPVDCDKVDAGIAMQWRKCVAAKESKMDCFEKNWSSFKTDYPNCSIEFCLAACFESYGFAKEYCIRRCAN